MSLNFPDSPAVNDEFTSGGQTWVWNGSVWSAYRGASTIVASSTAPSNPVEGALWFNSSNARTYVYYDGFWINLTSAGPQGPQGESYGLDLFNSMYFV